ncbi:defender against death DAD protein [Eremomyces bilateralis CBS 781.70]|uniref:Dolichyl-diphosphooligosaccharide--protein glycosyltransferase subunit OST2 n=1 Tax=Eremomyces bilateralis CBS 781.70 TaxID=1392243 RepID=A0A6G1G0B2_9PEZI|nr:defender against death DAD protein [Eremomyces bilateralis CBS 781.70]KAF1811360.1 defender against death DAD protein [Eremomyces bilateralis CBS 781.70]
MAPRNRAPAASTPSTPSSQPTPSRTKTASNPQHIIHGVWNNYVAKTPQRTKLIDTFMAFLMVVGAVQFAYCVVAGNYPFNAFLSGFGATVGQFVLTASLRIQTNVENEGEFKNISNERAFADYIFGSLLLHFFCVNFIN